MIKLELPQSFRRIGLTLAREPGHPDGEVHHGYWLIAPLDVEGRIDAEQWRAHREACQVVRFRPNADTVSGVLRRRPGGSWAFHYDLERGEDDDPAYRLDDHRFVEGEYVTIQEDDMAHTYRVASVRLL